MQLLIGFALVAMVLTLGGIYGVISLSVTTRRSEIAIRAALGADRRRLLRLVVGEGLRLVVGGVVLGFVMALALSRVVASMLVNTRPTDPTTFIGVGAFFVVAAVLVCCAPAWRAAQIDAVETLRGS